MPRIVYPYWQERLPGEYFIQYFLYKIGEKENDMQIPLQITFRHLEPSDAIEADIRDKAQKLERFANDITSCRVVVEAPHKHHHKGRIYTVSIDITVPGDEIVASRHPDKQHAHEDAYVAIRDAFNAAQRQLEDYVRERRGKVKSHETPPMVKL